MRTFARPTIATVLTLALLGAACESDSVAPVAPAGVPGIQAARAHFNIDKYSDDGSRPTIGTSGIASVQAEALIGSSGITTLEVYSFLGTDLSKPAGDIDSMVVQAFSPQGVLKLSRTYADNQVSHSFIDAYPGLARSDYLVIAAKVSGLAKGVFNNVIVQPVSIRNRPDLSVGSPSAGSLVANAPMIITADVTELNGDRGARTDCLLEVDGAVVDQARSIWVDAGDVVTCAFSHTFAVARPYRLGIRLSKTRPGDDFFENDTVSVLATVAAPVPPGTLATTTYEAHVRSGTITATDSGSSTWTDATTGRLLLDSRYQSSRSGRDESIVMTGVLNRALPFPISGVELRQTTDHVLIHSAKFGPITADAPGGECFTRDVVGAWFYLCVDPAAGYTTWTYLRSGGTVIYQSTGFSNAWNGTSYVPDSWVTNDAVDAGPLIARLGPDYTIDVRLLDFNDLYVAAAVVPFRASTEVSGAPWLCRPGTLTLADGTTAITSDCTFSSYTFVGQTGAVQGTGVGVQP